MAYEANSDEELEKQRSNANNANNVRNAADVAIATGNPYGVAAGGAIKAVDAVTGGKGSEIVGNALSTANRIVPGGNALQNASNSLSESGLSDAVGNAASIKNGIDARKASGATQTEQNGELSVGGEQSGSLPSSDEGNTPSNSISAISSGGDANSDAGGDSSQSDSVEESEEKRRSITSFIGKGIVRAIAILAIPFFIIILVLFVAMASVSSIFGEFEDAFGISDVSDEDTGGLTVETSTKEQKELFERVNTLKLTYQAQGKDVDSLAVVSVFHVLKNNGAKIDYAKITDSDIRNVMDAMLMDNMYDESTFKNNLITSIIPRYLPKTSSADRSKIAEEIFTYMDDYNSLIGRQSNRSNSNSSYTLCTNESGKCSYNLKGYYIPGKGNVKETIEASNIYVRLMQCGSSNGKNYGGTFGNALVGEELIPFEKYVLGVSYAAMGENASSEAFKAQTVVSRSYILARHADLGGWRSLEKESSGRWILQVAACNLDQIYCDPDKGCSSDEGGQVHSGTQYKGGYSKEALSSSSPLRSYAAATEGELLVNSQGYVIYSGYSNTEKSSFTSLATSGLNYKQILLQVYNQGSRKYGASSIQKNSCTNESTSANNCVSSGEYTQWKQYDAAWGSVMVGSSGKTIRQIGCLATAVCAQIARSGVPTNIPNLNPGTFVEYLSKNGGFSGGNFVWRSASKVAPRFQYQGSVSVAGMSKEQKLAKMNELLSSGAYIVVEVKGNTGQHWVAVESINGNSIKMIDPGSPATDMWAKYNWVNTSRIAYFRVQ